MSGSHGQFVWYELMTSDTAAAQTFYCGVVGWAARDSGLPNSAYTILSIAETPIAGLMDLPAEAARNGARPGWVGYVAVEDVDAVSAQVIEAGGAVHRGPEDIPEVGRFAVVADPQHAVFVLFRGIGEPPKPPPALDTPGHAGWRELHAAEWQSAFAFYAGLFGWTKDETVDMGPMGLYQLFAAGGPPPIGGMMTKTNATPRPAWLYYFNVGDIEVAATRVADHGGRVLNGPHPVPGGMWILQCLDPQGAMFALVGHRSGSVPGAA